MICTYVTKDVWIIFCTNFEQKWPSNIYRISLNSSTLLLDLDG